MATFRTMLEQNVGLPMIPNVVDPVASQKLQLFDTVARTINTTLRVLGNEKDQESQGLAVIAQGQARDLQARTQEAERKTKEFETVGLPAMIGNLDGDQLQKVLKDNPGLSPNAANTIAEGVAKKYAANDILNLIKLVAEDPSRNVTGNLTDIIDFRSSAFTDARAMGYYKLTMNEHAQGLMTRAVVEQAAKANNEAIDGFTEDLRNKIGFDLSGGNLPNSFEKILDDYVTKVGPLAQNMSSVDLRNRAIADITGLVAGPVGQSMGLNPENSLKQITSLNEKIGSKYPQLGGLQQALQSAVVGKRVAMAETLSKNMEEVFKVADNKGIINENLAKVQEAKNSGLLTNLQVYGLNAMAKEGLDRVAKKDDVYRSLGVKVDATGNLTGDFNSPTDNVTVNLGPEHDSAIDSVANQLGLQGEARTTWMLNNQRRVTESVVKDIAAMGNSSDPNQFASALNQYNLMFNSSPVYAKTLIDSKKLPAKLETAAILSTLGGQDPRIVMQRVAGVSEDALSMGRAMLETTKSDTKAEKEAMGITQAQTDSYNDISKKVFPGTFRFGFGEAAGGFPSQEAQSLYRSQFALTVATYIQKHGQTDPKVLYKVADQTATELLKQEVSMLEVGDQRYMVMNNKKNAWGLRDAMWDQIGTLWSAQRMDNEKKSGVPAANQRLDLNNLQVDPNDRSKYVVPIVTFDLWNNQDVPNGTFSFPRTRLELKDAEKKVREADPLRQMWLGYTPG